MKNILASLFLLGLITSGAYASDGKCPCGDGKSKCHCKEKCDCKECQDKDKKEEKK